MRDLVGILLRFGVAAVLTWVAVIGVSHGGVWYLLLIPTVPLALFNLTFGGALLWSWANERSRVG